MQILGVNYYSKFKPLLEEALVQCKIVLFERSQGKIDIVIHDYGTDELTVSLYYALPKTISDERSMELEQAFDALEKLISYLNGFLIAKGVSPNEIFMNLEWWKRKIKQEK